MSAPSPPDPAPGVRPVSAITPRRVEWLWPGRLGLGKLALLEGDPGLGKSFVALDLCARLSAGRPWPDGSPAAAPAASLYLNGEDGEEDTLGPRLLALGADAARVFVLDRPEDSAALLSLPAQTDALADLVARVQARLLVIDPVMQFFGPGVTTSGDASIRRALAPLAALARRQACTVLLVRHLTKVGRGPAIHRGLGSVGLVGACRSAWLVAEQAEGSARRVLAQVKNNLAPRQPSLAFEVTQAEGAAPALQWLGPVEDTADRLLAPRRGRNPARREAACEFLRRTLADTPLRAPDLWKRASAEGFSVNTIGNAKKELGVRTEWVYVNGRPVSYWLLAGQQLPPEIRPPTESDEVDECLRLLEAKYPSRSPLDDL